ncbi:transposase [Emergencia timonensis]|nr:transposase [Emergencia timonensis]WNX90319.1 transposase [Emergencia timonensis]
MDLSSLFRETARRCFPKAEIVADSFHVVQQATRAMENVRKRVQKDLAKGRRKYFKRSRNLLLNSWNRYPPCSPSQKASPPHTTCSTRCNGVMGSKDVHEAKKWLSDWFMAVNAADVEEFTECAWTYADWMEEILNIFRTGLSNAYTEGCNNRIKVIKRNAYGMRNFERFRKRILHCMSS